ncbi:MAG TPA: hypothetical protein VFP65_03665 [Anaeromyxobacteraceae bacterium]|nr:hypothetical protein [Anaeromyxobacteraceae bacterium]
MSCPYLTEVTMCFCRAFPVKKLVPVHGVVTDSACEGEAYGGCPVFREAAARLGHAPADLDQLVHLQVNHGGKS